MSLNQICSNNNNKFLPEVYLADLRTDSLVLQNSNLSGYVPSNLNVCDNRTVTISYSGALSGNINVKCSRVGNLITITLPVIFGTSTTGGQITTSFLPALFRPTSDLFKIAFVETNSIPASGLFEIFANGDMRIIKTLSTTFNVSDVILIPSTSFSYCV